MGAGLERGRGRHRGVPLDSLRKEAEAQWSRGGGARGRGEFCPRCGGHGEFRSVRHKAVTVGSSDVYQGIESLLMKRLPSTVGVEDVGN